MIENLRTFWNKTSPGGRIGALAAVALIVAAAIWAMTWSHRDNEQVLFSDLDSQDAAAMVAELEKLKIPHRLSDGGKTILVAKDAVYRTRLKVMDSSVPLRGTVGFEIFNNTDFGMTEFAQKINYQRALQGELARTISGFEEIKHARVHLVMPESGLFRKGGAKPKASITVVMKEGAALRPEQVVGIQRLVAASVPEIGPASVTVLDQHGIALSRPAEAEGEEQAVAGKIETKKQLETYLTRKALEVLDKAFGPGQAIVRIDVTLNQDHVKVTREEVLPLVSRNGEAMGAVTRRKQTAHGSYRDALTPAEGSARDAPKAGGQSSLEMEYQNGRKVEQVVSSPGSIKRLSVGILVPRQLEPDRADRLRTVIAMAVGLNVARGDGIAIYFADTVSSVAGGKAGAVAEPAVIPPMKEAPGISAGTFAVWDATRISYALAAVMFAIGLYLLLLGRNSRRRSGPPVDSSLSETEREQVLKQIRAWLERESQDTRRRSA